MNRPLTERQIAALKRLAKEGGREHFSPDLAKQLVARGVATLTGRKYTRREYNRPVKGSTIWEVELTAAGRNVLPVIGVELKPSVGMTLNAVELAKRE